MFGALKAAAQACKESVKVGAREFTRVLGLKLQEHRQEASQRYKRTHDASGYKKPAKASKSK